VADVITEFGCLPLSQAGGNEKRHHSFVFWAPNFPFPQLVQFLTRQSSV